MKRHITKVVTFLDDGRIVVDGRTYREDRACRPECVDRVTPEGDLHRMFHHCSVCGRPLPYEAEKGHGCFCTYCGAHVEEER